jgi:hypothetical protein
MTQSVLCTKSGLELGLGNERSGLGLGLGGKHHRYINSVGYADEARVKVRVQFLAL